MAALTQVPVQVYDVRGDTVTLPPAVVTANFNPGVNNLALVGSMWINYLNNNAFLLTSTEGPAANWTNISAGGAAGPIDTVNTDAGAVNPVAGAISIIGGNQVHITGAGANATVNVVADPVFHSVSSTTTVNATTTMTAGTGITATAGNITAALGNVVLTVGDVIANTGHVQSDYFSFSVAGTVIISGIGDPNGVSAATQGSLFLRTDGDDVDNRAYINIDNNMGWAAITTAS